MFFVNKKSQLSVKWILITAIIIILVIGLIGMVQLFFPWLGTGFSCIKLQENHIFDMNTLIEEVKLTGEEQIVRFRVEECTKCIWFNTEDGQLEVEYKAGSSRSYPTPLVWSGNIDDESSCSDGHLVGTEGRKVCMVDITVNSLVVSCPS